MRKNLVCLCGCTICASLMLMFSSCDLYTSQAPQHVQRSSQVYIDYSPYIDNAMPRASFEVMKALCGNYVGDASYEYEKKDVRHDDEANRTYCFVVMKWQAKTGSFSNKVYDCEISGTIYTNGKEIMFEPKEVNAGLDICMFAKYRGGGLLKKQFSYKL